MTRAQAVGGSMGSLWHQGLSLGGWRLGTPGYLMCLLFSLAVAVTVQGWRSAVACGLGLLLAAAFYPAGLRPFASRRMWLFLALLMVPSALFLGAGNWVVGPLVLSSEGLAAGLQMALRAATILVAVTGFAATVPVGDLAGLMERAGLKGLGFALGVAVNMLPTVQETVTNAYQALRLRGGFRRQRLQAVRFLLVTVVVNSLRHADDIVNAAEARAFAVDRVWLRPIVWRRGDVALAGILSAALVILLLGW